jgi:hypothetical protein
VVLAVPAVPVAPPAPAVLPAKPPAPATVEELPIVPVEPLVALSEHPKRINPRNGEKALQHFSIGWTCSTIAYQLPFPKVDFSEGGELGRRRN